MYFVFICVLFFFPILLFFIKFCLFLHLHAISIMDSCSKSAIRTACFCGISWSQDLAVPNWGAKHHMVDSYPEDSFFSFS